MNTTAIEEIRFPVGDFTIDLRVTPEKRRLWIDQLANAPAKLRAALAGLSEAQLNERYREGGWMLRQVVHHLADAQLNGFVRFKLALTEDRPAIKTYEETLWAENRTGARPRSNFRSPCWMPCTPAGPSCWSPCRKRHSAALSVIPSVANSRLTTRFSSTPGMVAITRRTLLACASVKAGREPDQADALASRRTSAASRKYPKPTASGMMPKKAATQASGSCRAINAKVRV